MDQGYLVLIFFRRTWTKVIQSILSTEKQFVEDRSKFSISIYREMTSRNIVLSYAIWRDEHYIGRCFLSSLFTVYGGSRILHEVSLMLMLLILLLICWVFRWRKQLKRSVIIGVFIIGWISWRRYLCVSELLVDLIVLLEHICCCW